MTKKDCKKLASVIKETKKTITDNYQGYELISAVEAVTLLQENLTVELQKDNPAFDSEKFYDDCELD